MAEVDTVVGSDSTQAAPGRCATRCRRKGGGPDNDVPPCQQPWQQF